MAVLVAHRPRPTTMPYPEVVEEAIFFGWIDSTANLLDDDRGLQLITPRKAKSPWSRLNRQRAAAMERRGLMTDAGRAAINAAKAKGWRTISDQVEDLEEPADLACECRQSRPMVSPASP
ncbi:YdeI/OmpD-associated family protein [Nonomuraea insulae]|uniref:YdeI family protein n=1 Tax=Nonomuraea insulae TaxID=1616787 RepID=A0ABW1DB87_9ACTN